MQYPWLTEIYTNISQSILNGHQHHALLFQTRNGLGVEQLIKQLAKWLLCLDKQNIQTCNNCQACLLFDKETNPDYYYVSNEEQNSIGIEQIRELNNYVQQACHLQQNKVILINDLSLLTEAAANALLKTLEEPETNCYFLLQIPEYANILPTIFSRCQKWHIPTPCQQIICDWLTQQGQYNTTDIQIAYQISYAKPLIALQFLQQNLLTTRLNFLRKFWLFHKHKNLIKFSQTFNNEILFYQLDWLNSFILDSLKVKMNAVTSMINQDLITGINQYAKENSLNQLENYLKNCQQTIIYLANENINRQLLINNFLAELILISAKK